MKDRPVVAPNLGVYHSELAERGAEESDPIWTLRAAHYALSVAGVTTHADFLTREQLKKVDACPGFNRFELLLVERIRLLVAERDDLRQRVAAI